MKPHIFSAVNSPYWLAEHFFQQLGHQAVQVMCHTQI